jgi:adenosylcobinamide-phosphate guanylyltransferase
MIVILAGGRSSRMRTEKPVLEINGKPMIVRVFERADEVDRTIAAVSTHTPRTKELCAEYGIEYIETSGRGYVPDLVELLDEFDEFISSPSDIPFVTSTDFKMMTEEFKRLKVNLVGVLTPTIIPPGVKPVIYRNYVITGLNAVIRHNERECFVTLKNPFLAINVNTWEDFELAQKIAAVLDGYEGDSQKKSANIMDCLQQRFKF